MRQRFNRNAICSSYNYTASRHSHLDMLKENHSSICLMAISHEADPNFHRPCTNVTIMVWGKPMVVSHADYEQLNMKSLGF